jgi:predicted dehydrogenase
MGYPGGSDDFELSHSRVGKFTEQLRNEFGVKIADSPDAVAEACDLVFITAADGRTHLDYVRKTISARKPTFIDKPLAVRSEDAREIMRLGEQHHVPIMSASSLRYAPPLLDALHDDALGKIAAADVFGPMPIEPTQGGLFWYGIHSVELLNRVMGSGLRRGADDDSAETRRRGRHLERRPRRHRPRPPRRSRKIRRDDPPRQRHPIRRSPTAAQNAAPTPTCSTP